MSFRIKCWLVMMIPLCGIAMTVVQGQDYIQGRVVDSVTGEAIPFATIFLQESHIGIYANNEGDFRIRRRGIPASDSLIITCIGYDRFSLSVNMLSLTDWNIIRMHPTSYQLDQVEVKAKGKNVRPERIVARALKRIRKNYPTTSFDYIAYYRDYQKKDDQYLNLNEALVQVLDQGFKKLIHDNRFRLLEYKQNQDFARKDFSPYYEYVKPEQSQTGDKVIPQAVLPDQGGNELFILTVHDAIRNYRGSSFSMVHMMYRDFIGNHVFDEVDVQYLGDTPLLRIPFEAREKYTIDSLHLYGSIYIDPERYAIHKLEYYSDYTHGKRAGKRMYAIQIEYGSDKINDDRMALKYISFNNMFTVVDFEDTTYFRTEKAYWDPSDPLTNILIMEFNHKVEPEIAQLQNLYEIFWEDQPLEIEDISVLGKEVQLTMKEPRREYGAYRIQAHELKDVDGMILDQRPSLELYQFRELFVQEYEADLMLSDPCFVKEYPLDRNCVSAYQSNADFWMNTPMQEE